VEMLGQIIKGEIRGMYIMGENPAMSDPDTHHARAALAQLDFLLCQEIFLTETCAFADVILPASAFPEKSGSFTNSNRQVQLARPALKLLGETKQDWEIITLVAKEMGLNWHHDGVSAVYEEMRQTMPSIKGISWQRLVAAGAVTYPCADATDPGQPVIFTNGFPTADGRMKLVPVDLLPPAELPDADYPTILTTGRLLEHWHTGAMTRRANILDGMEWAAIAHLHPADMAAQSLQQGDEITISTRRGSITVPVRGDRDVARGMVFVPFCFAEGAANILTTPALDPYGKIPEFKFCAARVEKTPTAPTMGHNLP
ncbi:MAG: molybdopterin-dependent oxidoreductase, partial [Alphaproteobacteria bacterium]|nr:molybdopterin-dependent oxidoreductase [Alphaproteobacteria bacterium]